MPNTNIFDLLLFLSDNLLNKIFLYTSISFIFLNSKTLSSVNNIFSFSIKPLFNVKVIMTHPTIIKFDIPDKLKIVFNIMPKENQVLKYHPK